jgi:hypothetical protein
VKKKLLENVAVSTLIFFISNEPYDDDITFKLAIAVSEEMNMSIGGVNCLR